MFSHKLASLLTLLTSACIGMIMLASCSMMGEVVRTAPSPSPRGHYHRPRLVVAMPQVRRPQASCRPVAERPVQARRAPSLTYITNWFRIYSNTSPDLHSA